MTKFDRVLSDEEMTDVINGGCTEDLFSLAERVEQAVVAKLAAEQEPVAWTSSKIFGHYVTHDTKTASEEWFKESLDVPLYAHPCVSPTSDKADAERMRNALNKIAAMNSMSYHSLETAKITAKAAMEPRK